MAEEQQNPKPKPQPTKREYFEATSKLRSKATFLSLHEEEAGRVALVLDSTVFQPQGGGQPCDTGHVDGFEADRRFVVEDVRVKDGGLDSTPRIVKIGNSPGCPCGGTHVADIAEIRSLKGGNLGFMDVEDEASIHYRKSELMTKADIPGNISVTLLVLQPKKQLC